MIFILTMRNDKGVIAPIIGLLLTVIMGYMGLVTDVSSLFNFESRTKSAVDLAALAGASQLSAENVDPIGNSKSVALNFLNQNLSATTPGFTSLSLSDSNLDIQIGTYDSTTQVFTWDESVPTAVNAIKISYTYTKDNVIASYFMINTSMSTVTSIASKFGAGSMPPGTGFPLVVKANQFCSDVSANMITLTTGMSGNSWWTAFDSMGGTNEANNILNYWESGVGTVPPGLDVFDEFKMHLGNDSNVWSSINGALLVNNTYVLPVGTDTGGNMIRADGFVGATVDAIDTVAETLDLTIIPGYVVSNYMGATIGVGVNDSAVCPGGFSYLTNAFSLVK